MHEILVSVCTDLFWQTAHIPAHIYLLHACSRSMYPSYNDKSCMWLPHDHHWLSCVKPCSDCFFKFIASWTACIAWRNHTPSQGRALASASDAGNHRGMPRTMGQSRPNQFKLLGVTADRLTISEHNQSCLGSPSMCSTMS